MSGFKFFFECELYCPGSFSLKDKRQIVRRLIDRLTGRFNLAVAEVDNQDHQRLITLSMASVSSSKKQLISLQDKIVRELDLAVDFELRNYHRKIF